MVLRAKILAVLLVMIVFTSVVVEISLGEDDHEVWTLSSSKSMYAKNQPTRAFSRKRGQSRPTREVQKNSKVSRRSLCFAI